MSEFKINDIADVYGKILETRNKHQEAMALAFLQHTGLPIDKIELVEMRTETGYRWFFKELEPGLREKMDYSGLVRSTEI
jgi:hypothetical protein